MSCPFCNGTIDHAALGRELREKRLALGVFQNRVAKSMHLCPTHLSMMEKGKRRWTKLQRDAYLKALKEPGAQRKPKKQRVISRKAWSAKCPKCERVVRAVLDCAGKRRLAIHAAGNEFCGGGYAPVKTENLIRPTV